MHVMGYIIMCVLAVHFVADFYAQTDKMAEAKERSVRYLIVHCAVYTVAAGLLLSVLIAGAGVMAVWLIMSVSHALIDGLKYCIREKIANDHLSVFCIDQIVHCLITIVAVWALSGEIEPSFPALCIAQSVGHESFVRVLEILFSLVVVGKPASVLISKILKPADDKIGLKQGDEDETNSQAGIKPSTIRAGKWIGILERIIVVVMTLWGEFGAIAFVLTAKSIARFDMLKNQDFAERYLVGTLASAVMAILVALTAKGLLS